MKLITVIFLTSISIILNSDIDKSPDYKLCNTRELEIPIYSGFITYDKENIINDNFDIKEFMNMNPNEKIKFINSLDKPSKFILLNIMLKSFTFGVPPITMFKCKPNGIINSYGLSSDNKNNPDSYWKISNNQIKFWKNNKRAFFPENNLEIYNDYKASWWCNSCNFAQIQLHFYEINKYEPSLAISIEYFNQNY